MSEKICQAGGLTVEIPYWTVEISAVLVFARMFRFWPVSSDGKVADGMGQAVDERFTVCCRSSGTKD